MSYVLCFAEWEPASTRLFGHMNWSPDERYAVAVSHGGAASLARARQFYMGGRAPGVGAHFIVRHVNMLHWCWSQNTLLLIGPPV